MNLKFKPITNIFTYHTWLLLLVDKKVVLTIALYLILLIISGQLPVSDLTLMTSCIRSNVLEQTDSDFQ